MTPAQLASWQRRLDCCLADPRPCHDALQALFGEMLQALVWHAEEREKLLRLAARLDKQLDAAEKYAGRVERLAAKRCVELQADLKALTRYEDQLAKYASPNTLPPDGLAALLKKKGDRSS